MKNKRRKIFDKFNGRCAYCGCKITYRNFDIEHVIPKSKGGTRDIKNLYPSCKTCNGFKGQLSLEEFRNKIMNLKRDFTVVDLFTKYYGFKKRMIKFYFETVGDLSVRS